MTKTTNTLAAIAISVLFFTATTASAGGSRFAHVAAFAGATNSGSSTHLTLGAELEIKPPALLGFIGIETIGERIFSAPAVHVAGIGLAVHPLLGFKFRAIPGLLLAGSSHFLMRVGAGYDFSFTPLIITPSFNLDFVNGQTLKVFGVSVGVGI
ncbi:MAG: hypothetical protein A2583_05245 [Bdellovibrionales bacterium RIFOXYD1_FULL_53_11]|nr:MAG: hypothetical protein A2583_05245 [Bdellovibrionales bacterium RIFOXYD1_FULL_53_11]